MKIKKIQILLFSIFISVTISSIIVIPWIYQECDKILTKIEQAKNEVFNMTLLPSLNINKYPSNYTGFFKEKSKYPKLLENKNYFNERYDYFQNLFNNGSSYALYVERKRIPYKKTLSFRETENRITTVFYDNNDKLINVEIYNGNGAYEDSAYTYDKKGKLINATQNGVGVSSDPISFLFNSNKKLITYCYLDSCLTGISLPFTDATPTVLMKTIISMIIMVILPIALVIAIGILILLLPLFILWFAIYKNREKRNNIENNINN